VDLSWGFAPKEAPLEPASAFGVIKEELGSGWMEFEDAEMS